MDEADEMLSSGFKDQIYDVFRHLTMISSKPSGPTTSSSSSWMRLVTIVSIYGFVSSSVLFVSAIGDCVLPNQT